MSWRTGMQKRKQSGVGNTDFSVKRLQRAEIKLQIHLRARGLALRYALLRSRPGTDPEGTGWGERPGSEGKGGRSGASSPLTRSQLLPRPSRRATPWPQPPQRRCLSPPAAPRPPLPPAGPPQRRARGRGGRRHPARGRRRPVGRTGRAGEFIPLEGNSFSR